MTEPTPDKVMQLITGGWAASILGAAARHGLFTALEGHPARRGSDREESRHLDPRCAGATRWPDRTWAADILGAGTYQNTPEASAFLVKGKPSYLGAMAEVFLEDFGTWQKLPEAVKTGLPTAPHTADVADNPFWHVLVTAIAPLSFPVAQMAAERLALAAAGPISWLDVGGGSGVWSAAWLGVNKQATGYQLDWPRVNAIGREFVARFGVGDRFKTLDGDFHTTDFGAAKYDYAIYSHIAHQEAPADNIDHLPQVPQGAQTRRHPRRQRFRPQR